MTVGKWAKRKWASKPTAVYSVILISISISRVITFYLESIAYQRAQNILLPESRFLSDINSNAIVRKAPGGIGGCSL